LDKWFLWFEPEPEPEPNQTNRTSSIGLVLVLLVWYWFYWFGLVLVLVLTKWVLNQTELNFGIPNTFCILQNEKFSFHSAMSQKDTLYIGLNLGRILHSSDSNCLESDTEGNNLLNAKLRQKI